MERVFIAVINDLVSDQRIGRVAGLLMREEYEVRAIGRITSETPSSHRFPFKVRRYRMLFRKGPLFYAFYNIRLFFTLLFAPRAALYISNDLDTLLAMQLAARIRRVPLLYDSHEYFTEVPELIGRKRVQAFWKTLEGKLLPGVSHRITVSLSLADLYQQEYGLEFEVVRNVPVSLESHKELEKQECMIYQGALNLGRGIELMIDSMQYLDEFELLLVGAGDIEMELRERVLRLGLEDRVRFMGRMSPAQLRDLTRTCRLGLSLEEDLGLNYRYALPNKIFDYIQARIPLICSELPEMEKLVSGLGVGEICREREAEALANQVREVLNKEKDGIYRNALEKAAGELNWEKESARYLGMVRMALGKQ